MVVLLGLLLLPVLFAILPAPRANSNNPALGKVSASQPPSLTLVRSGGRNFRVPSSLDLRLAAAETQSDLDDRSAFLEHWAASLTPDKLLPTLESLSLKHGPIVSELRHLVVSRLVQLSPEQAADWLAHTPDVTDREAFLNQISTTWAALDLASALRWSATLPRVESQAAILDIAYETARTDPKGALSLASSLPAAPERVPLLTFAVSQWASSDSASATQWAQQVPDQSLRQELLASIAVASAKQDPGIAAALVMTGLQDQTIRDRAEVAVVQRWAQVAPEQAATWVSQLTGTPAESEAAWNLVTLWESYDRVAAAAWIQTLPVGPVRNSALQAFGAVHASP